MSHEYEQACGILEWACTSAAIDIETLCQHFAISVEVRTELLKTASDLRRAKKRSEDMTGEFGSPRSVRASEPINSNEPRSIF